MVERNKRSGKKTENVPSKEEEIRSLQNSERFHQIFDLASPARPYSKILESARNPQVWHTDALTRTRNLLGELIPDYTNYDQKALGDLFFQAWAVNRSIVKARGQETGVLLGVYEVEKEEILEEVDPSERNIVRAIHETIVEKGIYKSIAKGLEKLSK